jgi:hypothetical protein
MAIYLPGITHPRDLCSLCDNPARYVAILRIKITDPFTSKMIATEIDLYVCELHAVEMDIEIDKTLKDAKRIIIV